MDEHELVGLGRAFARGHGLLERHQRATSHYDCEQGQRRTPLLARREPQGRCCQHQRQRREPAEMREQLRRPCQPGIFAGLEAGEQRGVESGLAAT